MEQNKAEFISTANEFCDQIYCSPYLDEEIIYINASHLSQKEYILEQILAKDIQRKSIN